MATTTPRTRYRIQINSKAAIVHLGSLDSFDRTEAGTQAARLLLDAAETGRLESAREAIRIYQRIVPTENFGGEYTALQWLAEYLTADREEQARLRTDRYANEFFHLFGDNEFAVLKEYLRSKYKLTPQPDTPDAARRFRFLEDFILCFNPRREQWEKSSRVLAALGLKRGDVVADVGSGSGYFACKFAELVGPQGKVYAVENNPLHLQHLDGVLRRLGLTNVEPIAPPIEGVGLPEGVQVDVAFTCSLYHIVYCTFTEGERHAFVEGIKRCLKPGGRLIVVDNALVEDVTLPYHGPYIAEELILGQLSYSGFRLAAWHQFIPQRYVLVFELDETPAPPEPAAAPEPEGWITIDSPVSLVQGVKAPRGPEFTSVARRAARDLYQALDTGDADAARSAKRQYEGIVAGEPAGNEYSAFGWFCDYVLAPPEKRKEFLRDPFVAEYFQHLGGDAFTQLKNYVRGRYLLDVPDDDLQVAAGSIDPRFAAAGMTREQARDWHEFIAFNNPRRDGWEKTGRMLEFLGLRPGESVADIGCGPGYFTFKFARLVGPTGRVYAVETGDEPLRFVRELAQKHGMTNVTPLKAAYNDAKLPAASTDVVFVCSAYHAVYVTNMEYVREQFLNGIRAALCQGGRLVVVDNEPTDRLRPAYYGPRIDRRLIIEQLKYFGFRLADTAQFIPQRYVLAFRQA
jgi:predicted methyltransferase